MRSLLRLATLPIILVGMIALALLMHAHHRRQTPVMLPAAPMAHEPNLMLWAWETPEDLTTLDPHRAGVAFLAREVLLGKDAAVRPRRQPLHVAPGTWLVAVVRVETGAGFQPDTEMARSTALAIAEVVSLPNVRGLQIDFDATVSQRDFYRRVLQEVREHLPAGYPLSITALASWCGPDSWLHALKVDEAVPMFFRMGGPATTRAVAPRSQDGIAEPLCSGSAGLATDEAWPALRPNQRVYLFRPGAWTQNEIARVNRFGYQGVRGFTSP